LRPTDGRLVSSPALARPSAAIVAKNDKDSDQTLDLAEVKAAAGARFDKLEKDKDGTLSVQELRSKNARLLKKLID
jgi:hypothetical protein